MGPGHEVLNEWDRFVGYRMQSCQTCDESHVREFTNSWIKRNLDWGTKQRVLTPTRGAASTQNGRAGERV